MNKRKKAVILLVSAWVGMGLILSIGLYMLPTLLNERNRLVEMRRKSSDRDALIEKSRSFSENFVSELERLKAEIDQRMNLLRSTEFTPMRDSLIPKFVNQLGTLFSESGATVLNLAWRPRTTKMGIVTLPFEARIRAAYQDFRVLIHRIESHPAGIKIDQLDFINLDDEANAVQISLSCSVRFSSNE